MTSKEHNNNDWREIRTRVDSIANAVFLIAGGALSLSISVILGNKDAGFITSQVACFAIIAWYSLLVSVCCFLFLKGNLVFQAYMLQSKPEFHKKHLAKINRFGWTLGVLGGICLFAGLFLMVHAAVIAVEAP